MLTRPHHAPRADRRALDLIRPSDAFATAVTTPRARLAPWPPTWAHTTAPPSSNVWRQALPFALALLAGLSVLLAAAPGRLS